MNCNAGNAILRAGEGMPSRLMRLGPRSIPEQAGATVSAEVCTSTEIELVANTRGKLG